MWGEGGMFLTDEELEAQRTKQAAASEPTTGADGAEHSSSDADEIDLPFDMDEELEAQPKAGLAAVGAATTVEEKPEKLLDVDDQDDDLISEHTLSAAPQNLTTSGGGGVMSVPSALPAWPHHPSGYQADDDDGLQFAMSFAPPSILSQQAASSMHTQGVGGSSVSAHLLGATTTDLSSPALKDRASSEELNPDLAARLEKIKLSEEEHKSDQDEDDLTDDTPQPYVPHADASARHASMPLLHDIGRSQPLKVPKGRSFSFTHYGADEDDSQSFSPPSTPSTPSPSGSLPIAIPGGISPSEPSAAIGSSGTTILATALMTDDAPELSTQPSPSATPAAHSATPDGTTPLRNPLLDFSDDDDTDGFVVGSVPGVHDRRRKGSWNHGF